MLPLTQVGKREQTDGREEINLNMKFKGNDYCQFNIFCTIQYNTLFLAPTGAQELLIFRLRSNV